MSLENESNTLQTEDERQTSFPQEELHNDVPDEAYASEESAITDINQLDLTTEPMGDVDMDKLEEQMAYAPSLTPGKFHDFIFKLNDGKPNSHEGAWQSMVMKGRPEVQYNFSLQHIKPDGSAGKVVRFQSASTFRSGKMTASRVQELLFALGKLDEFQNTQRKPGDILRLLSEASEAQTVISGQVKWEQREKTGEQKNGKDVYAVTRSTHPQKAYIKADGTKVPKEPDWPKDGDGKFERLPGNEQVMRVAPTKETMAAIHKRAGKAAA